MTRSHCPRKDPIAKFSRDERQDTRRKKYDRVNFSKTSCMTLICGSIKEEKMTRWFSRDDRRRFKLERSHHVIILRHWLLSHAYLPHDEIFQFIGVEGLLSSNLIQSARRRRENHIRAILSEYRRQQLDGIKDDDALSNLSQTISKRSVEIAQNTARIYWDAKE
mmetsp:Transcript_31365/g.64468  ORF Transcript_31365/g.64468 Transcript_31365/m.64468 type:complete len:164 (-) Transcript_31365:136-627(-)